MDASSRDSRQAAVLPRVQVTRRGERKPAAAIMARVASVAACLALLLGPLTGASGGAELQYPLSIAVSAEGTIFLADRNLPGVFRAKEGKLSVLFQASKRFRTPLNAVRCVALDREGKLLAGDSAARNVFRFDEAGKPIPITKETGGLGMIGIPMSVAVDSQGTIFASDLEIQRIVKVPAGSDQPVEVAEIAGCRGLFIDSQDRLWVVSTTQNQLHRIAPDGTQEVMVPGRPFQFPHTVVVAADGTAYVCDGYAKAIWKVVAGSEPTKLVEGGPFQNPVGMALQGDRLWVADPRVPGIFQVDFAGQVTPIPLQAADD
jgi:streptogramin lyase